MRLLPRWELIAELRRLVTRALERLEIDADHAYSASLATHELLENAVKYGQGEVRIVLDSDEKSVKRVAVENHTTQAQIVKLKRAVGELVAAGDPMRAYTAAMHARAGGGGLGLARVAAEGQMELECKTRSNHVAITASPGGPRA